MTTRTPAEAIAAVHRHGPTITVQQRVDALGLLTDLLETAARHGVALDDFDYIGDLPAMCVGLVVAKARRA